ncbi:MAG TPA: zinc-binding dehydrogenase [Acidimicrobiales bacterium]|jgi:NADPH:quinone reductase-like Zn-dependent oxidoreductase|nr:zinc-binding dehydrogenase [Acidimicrobiales bacterium]
MRALVAVPGAPGGAELREVAEPELAPGHVLVRVEAVSLNRGEVRALATAPEGWRPGWDLAGVVERSGADPTAPPEGARVVGVVGEGAWAELVAVPIRHLAPIPDEVRAAAASTLPVAGLTAYRTLLIGGASPDRPVLVTGAAGGVGHFAVQLAAHDGADVTAVVGHPGRGEKLRQLGASTVSVGMPAWGEYHTILESVGGRSLAAALGLSSHYGVVISYGNSSGETTTFDARTVYRRSGRLHGFYVFAEIERLGGATADLMMLAELVADGRLEAEVSLEADWREAPAAFAALMDRRVEGKAVLHVG